MSNFISKSNLFFALVFLTISSINGQNILISQGGIVNVSGGEMFYDAGNDGNVSYTITLLPAISGQGVCVDFTSFSSYETLEIFDGNSVAANNIGTLQGNYGVAYNAAGAPFNTGQALTGAIGAELKPGIFCSNNINGALTFRFTNINGSQSTGWEGNVITYVKNNVGCNVSITANPTTVCPGDAVTLTAVGAVGSSALNNDFNSGTFQFNNNQFKIENDKNYHLKIVTEDGKIVESDMRTLSNQMPLVTDFKLTVDTITKDWMYPEIQYSLKISWNDLIGEQNYYRLIANRLLKDFDSNDTIVEPLNYFNEYELKDDKGKDGQVLTANFKYIESGAMNSPIGFEIILMKVDVNYYNYYKTLNNYADGDPFAEPVILFSNIQNGLGVFCNFQTEKRRLFLFF